MTSRVNIRYATKEDLKKFYGDEDTMYYSSRAVVAELDGEILGVGGVCRTNSQMQVFTDIRSDKISPKDVIRAAYMVLEIINKYTSVVAYADPERTTADSFAKHFGFVPTGVSLNGSKQFYRMRHNGL